MDSKVYLRTQIFVFPFRFDDEVISTCIEVCICNVV